MLNHKHVVLILGLPSKFADLDLGSLNNLAQHDKCPIFSLSKITPPYCTPPPLVDLRQAGILTKSTIMETETSNGKRNPLNVETKMLHILFLLLSFSSGQKEAHSLT